MLDLRNQFGMMSDENYLSLLIDNIGSAKKNAHLPTFPDEKVQTQFVGSSFGDSLREAFAFYIHVKSLVAASGSQVSADDSFLDFGCGWGRFIRFFGRDVKVENIYGVDIDPDILSVCKATFVPGLLQRIEPTGLLPIKPSSIDLAIAYSVFTHLPEHIHLHWLDQLAAALKPRATFALTLEPRRFLNFVEEVATTGNTDWHRGMGAFADSVPKYQEDFDAGKFVYLPTGGGDFRSREIYGEAIVPLSFIEAHWTRYFEIVEYLDDPKRFWQALLVVRRK